MTTARTCFFLLTALALTYSQVQTPPTQASYTGRGAPGGGAL